MASMTENEILDTVYSLYETDTTNWDTDDEEYLAGREFCNAAIKRWEFYDNTKWNELYTTLTAAADGTKTIATSDWDYDMPTDFRRLTSFVRTKDSSDAVTFWTPIPSHQRAEFAKGEAKVVWVTGSEKAGFVLNFNPNIDLTTYNGDTIEYEYYKQATTFSATTSTTEMADPYFIVYFVLARFLKNDGEDNIEELQEADARLETMRVANMSGLFGVPDQINETIANNAGFGL